MNQDESSDGKPARPEPSPPGAQDLGPLFATIAALRRVLEPGRRWRETRPPGDPSLHSAKHHPWLYTYLTALDRELPGDHRQYAPEVWAFIGSHPPLVAAIQALDTVIIRHRLGLRPLGGMLVCRSAAYAERLIADLDAAAERLSAALSEALEERDGARPSPPRSPRWDPITLTLWLGEVPIRRYKRHNAPNQFLVLEAFQRAGWSRVVESPFRSDQRRLRETIDDLNRGLDPLAPLQFTVDHRQPAWIFRSASVLAKLPANFALTSL
jgi:hypothetical protein